MAAIIAWLLTNPVILGIGAAIIAAGTAWMHGRVTGAEAQKNADVAKEAQARAEDINAIKIAAGVSPAGSMSNDPNNRDKS